MHLPPFGEQLSVHIQPEKGSNDEWFFCYWFLFYCFDVVIALKLSKIIPGDCNYLFPELPAVNVKKWIREKCSKCMQLSSWSNTVLKHQRRNCWISVVQGWADFRSERATYLFCQSSTIRSQPQNEKPRRKARCKIMAESFSIITCNHVLYIYTGIPAVDWGICSTVPTLGYLLVQLQTHMQKMQTVGDKGRNLDWIPELCLSVKVLGNEDPPWLLEIYSWV